MSHRTGLLQLVMTIALLLAAALSASAQSEQTGMDQQLLDLEASLSAILDETGTPGMIGSIVFDQEVIWLGALGTADRSTGAAVTLDSRFRIGSISKSFVALTALKLAEQDQLSLELDIVEAVPEAGVENAWSETDPIQLYHTLEHTAGFDDVHLSEFAFSDPDITLLEAIELNTTSRIARWRPGTRMAYSNIGPAIAALAIEAATGESFETLVKTQVLDPLGMQHTSYHFHTDVVKSYRSDGTTPEPYIHIANRPSGSMNSTAADMAALLKMYLRRGRGDSGTLLSEAALQRMEHPRGTLAAAAGLRAGYGLSNSGNETDGYWYQGHGGGIDGFLSRYAYVPDINRGYFFSINASNGPALRRIDKRIREFLTADLNPPPQTPYLSGVDLQRIQGFYQPDAPRQEILKWLDLITGTVKVTSSGDQLMMTPMFGTRSVWRPLSENLFRKEAGITPTLAFVRSLDDEVLLQGPNVGTLQRIPAALAWARLVLIGLSTLLILSAAAFALIWVPRKLFSNAQIPAVSQRAWPALASVSLLASFGLLQAGTASAPQLLGNLTIYSLGFYLFTWLFAIITAIAGYKLIANFPLRHNGNVVAWWHSCAVGLACLFLLAYLGYYGLIGLQTWSY